MQPSRSFAEVHAHWPPRYTALLPSYFEEAVTVQQSSFGFLLIVVATILSICRSCRVTVPS